MIGEKSKKDADLRHQEDWEKFNCEYCGSEFLADSWRAKTARFCSTECMGKSKTESATVVCVCKNCNKEFEALKGQVSFWGEIKFCSVACATNSRKKQVLHTCVICNKEYSVPQCYSEKSVCCSNKCRNIWVKEVYSKRPEVIERLKRQGTKSQLNSKKSYTLPELLVFEYLSNIEVEFIPQHSVGDILVVDFFIPKYNAVLEVYGDYWHSNPRKYGDGKYPLNEMQQKNKQKDIRRYKVITGKYGYYFYSLWEYDIKNDLENAMNKFFEYIDVKIRNEQAVL
jgi:hypothetical protein